MLASGNGREGAREGGRGEQKEVGREAERKAEGRAGGGREAVMWEEATGLRVSLSWPRLTCMYSFLSVVPRRRRE